MDSRTQRIKNACASNYRKWLGLLGGFLIFIPAHFPNIWGNMSVYVVSYFYVNYGLLSASSSWVLSLVFVGMYTGLFVNGYVCLGPRMKIFLSILTFCAGPFVIHLSLVYGRVEILFSATLMMGLCTGLTDSTVLKAMADIAGDSSGTYISIVCSGYSFGPFFINSFTSWYINPDNLVPDVEIDNIHIFTQKDVIENVPSLFIILGTSYVVCRVIGFLLLLLSIPSSDNSTVQTKSRTYSTFSKDGESVDISTGSDTLGNGIAVLTNSYKSDEALSTSTGHTNSINTAASLNSYDSDNIISKIIISGESACAIHASDDNEDNDSPNRNNIIIDNQDLSPLQTLKYLPFYALWFAYGSQLFPFFLLNNFYKTFGLNWIKDDHFLTKLGSALALTGGIFRLVWGFALDRISIKTCLLSIYSSVGILIMVIYFMPAFNKWLYIVACLFLGCGIFSIFPTFVTVALVYFGDKHFFKNLGMLSSSRLLVSILISPLFEVLSRHFGWFAIFCCSASFVVISLILIVVAVPVKARNKRS